MKENPKTLHKFLITGPRASEELCKFAKDLTLEEFLEICCNGDWILWLFAKMNKDSLRELTLAKAHFSSTLRHLMKDERSTKAVDVAIAFGEGKATREELDAAMRDAEAATTDAAHLAFAARAAADEAFESATSALQCAKDMVDNYNNDRYRNSRGIDRDTARDLTNTAFDYYNVLRNNADALYSAYASSRDEFVAAAFVACDTPWCLWIDRKKFYQYRASEIYRKYLPLEIWDQSKL